MLELGFEVLSRGFSWRRRRLEDLPNSAIANRLVKSFADGAHVSDLVGFARAAEGDGVETPAVERFASLGGSQPSHQERETYIIGWVACTACRPQTRCTSISTPGLLCTHGTHGHSLMNIGGPVRDSLVI